jgi:Leucine-rich repeat (LRR) protein
LTSIDGIELMKNLKYLYLDKNLIENFFPVLKILDLRTLDIRENVGNNEAIRNIIKQNLIKLEWLNGTRC